MHRVVAIFSAALALILLSVRVISKTEIPLTACELYNKSSAVFLGRVIDQGYVNRPVVMNRVEPAFERVDTIRVAVLESLREKLPAEIQISAPYHSQSYMLAEQKFDPPMITGATYLLYGSGSSGTESGMYSEWNIIPAAQAPVEELRQLRRMKTGSIHGSLVGFMLSEREWMSTFVGRVLERGYGEGRVPWGDATSDTTGVQFPLAKIEIVRVKVLESFTNLPATEQEIWVSALPTKRDPQVLRFDPELEIGETYVFSGVDARLPVIRPEGFSGIVATKVLASRSVRLEQLRHLSKSEANSLTGGEMTITAKNENSHFERRVQASPRTGYHFDAIPPGTYSLEAEKEGIQFAGNWLVQVRAGGCAVADLKQADLLGLLQK